MALTNKIITQDDGSAAGQTFTRHRGPVTAVAPLPTRNALVSSAYDGAVGYFDIAERRVELLGYHEHLVNKVTVNAAGTVAATCSSDYTIRLWDLESRELLRTLYGHSDDVEDFAFIGDRLGVSASRDWRILVWDLSSGAIVRTIDGHDKDVLSVAYWNGRLISSGDDMSLRAWDFETGKLLRQWGPFENETDTCAIDVVHGRAVLGCDDGRVRVFDIDSGAALGEIEAHASGIKKVATSPATGDILSAAYDQCIRVWDADDFRLKADLEHLPRTWERSFAWWPDGTRIAAGTFDGTVVLWDAGTGRCLDEVGERETGNACLNDVTANSDGAFATVSDDGILRTGMLGPAQARWTRELTPQSACVLANAVTLHPDGRLIMGCHDQCLRIFDPAVAGHPRELEIRLSEGPINCVRVAGQPGYEGQIFAACYSGAVVRLASGGGIQAILRVHEGAVKALRLHPLQPIGVSCSADGSLLTWTYDGRVLTRFPGHLAIVDDVDIDPSGRFIASVSRDFTAKIFEIESGRLVQSLSLGRRSPKAVCYFDEWTLIVTNYWGSLLRFELPSGKLLARQIAKNGISSVARIRDQLIAVSYDGAAYLVRPDDLTVTQTLSCMTQRLQPSALF